MITLARSVADNPELVNAMVGHVTRNAQTICRTCRLQVMGHGPESKWLGYESHPFDAVAATPQEVEAAHRLTVLAYKNRHAPTPL